MFSKKTSPKPIDRRIESRRRWARYPVIGATVTVNTEDSTFEATTMDESIGGLGLHTKSPVALLPGQVVELVYRDVEMTGQVASMFPDAAGGCRLAISWDSAASATDVDSHRESFFRFRGVTITCAIVSDPPASGDSEAACQIRLWDGRLFDVVAQQIIRRSRDERCMELVTMGPARHVLTQLYELTPSSTPTVAVEKLLSFEFEGLRGDA